MADPIIFPTSSGILTAPQYSASLKTAAPWSNDSTAFARLLSALLASTAGTSSTSIASSTPSTTNSSAWLLPSWSLTTDNTIATKPAAADTSGSNTESAAPAKGFDEIMQTIFRHEGTRYVSNDGGRESSKFGILQSTAKQYGYSGNMKEMTQEQAKDIYRNLWEKSGAAKLSYPMSLVHFDSYINNPASARKFLAQAGDDVESYLQLRQDRYQRLADARPERFARYLKGWTNRINSLRTAANDTVMLASSSPVASGGS